MPGHTLVLVAAAALIDEDHRILLAQRPEGKALSGYWEFPGGKVEPGERPEDCLIRELNEELGIEVTEPCLAPFVFASHTYDDFHLLMPVFLCRRWNGHVRAREGQAIKWVKPLQLRNFKLPPADLPIVHHLEELLTIGD